MKVFVQWYNHDHRHSRIKFVTPQQRHTGEDIKLLKKRQRLYSKMMKMYPAPGQQQREIDRSLTLD